MTDPVSLPPLPEPDWLEKWATRSMPVAQRWFGEEKMRAYATEAVMAERERCAKLCDALEGFRSGDYGGSYEGGWDSAVSYCAAAIRSPKE